METSGNLEWCPPYPTPEGKVAFQVLSGRGSFLKTRLPFPQIKQTVAFQS